MLQAVGLDPELVMHPLTVTNFREIYNDHISAHIMAFVLAFARGLQVYLPAFTTATSVTAQTEAQAVSETDPTTGFQSAQIETVTDNRALEPSVPPAVHARADEFGR